MRFSYQEQREYDSIDDEIAALEQSIAECDQQMQECTDDYVKLQSILAEKSQLETQLEEKMERWIYLNELAQRIAQQKETP